MQAWQIKTTIRCSSSRIQSILILSRRVATISDRLNETLHSSSRIKWLYEADIHIELKRIRCVPSATPQTVRFSGYRWSVQRVALVARAFYICVFQHFPPPQAATTSATYKNPLIVLCILCARESEKPPREKNRREITAKTMNTLIMTYRLEARRLLYNNRVCVKYLALQKQNSLTCVQFYAIILLFMCMRPAACAPFFSLGSSASAYKTILVSPFDLENTWHRRCLLCFVLHMLCLSSFFFVFWLRSRHILLSFYSLLWHS